MDVERGLGSQRRGESRRIFAGTSAASALPMVSAHNGFINQLVEKLCRYDVPILGISATSEVEDCVDVVRESLPAEVAGIRRTSPE